MTPPIQDSALTALERARTAQERFERRIDVQLRLPIEQAIAAGDLRLARSLIELRERNYKP